MQDRLLQDHELGSQAVFLVISVVVFFAVAMITSNWFFRDADESTESFREYYRSRRFRPWWANKFGLWLGISAAAAGICYAILPDLWNWILSLKHG